MKKNKREGKLRGGKVSERGRENKRERDRILRL